MLTIKLYKNCILNGNYNYVFSHGKRQGKNKTVFEEYLDTLVNDYIEIPYAYYTNTGELIINYDISNSTNIYDYNYMRIVEIDDETESIVRLTRYCFINEIIVSNGVVKIRYSEDIYHSYINNIVGMKKSFWCNSRILDFENHSNITLRKLPVEYDGNKSLINDLSYTQRAFMLIVNLQYYNASSWGESNDRDYKTFILSKLKRKIHRSGTDVIVDSIEENSRTFTYSEIYNAVKYIVELQSRQYKFVHKVSDNYITDRIDVSSCGRYFEIENFIVLPFSQSLSSKFKSIDIRSNYLYNDFLGDATNTISTSPVEIMQYPCCEIDELWDGNFISHSTKLYAPSGNISLFKLISVGTLSSQFPVLISGTDFTFEILVSVVKDGCFVYANFNNQLIDITEDFTYIVPFNVISGEENALRSMDRKLGIFNSIFSMGSSLISGISSVSEATKLSSSLTDRISKLMHTKSGRITTSSKRLEKAESLRERKSEIPYETLTNLSEPIENNVKSLNEIYKRNAPLYSISKGTFVKSRAILNALYGVCSFSINPNNEDYVKNSVKNCGWEIYEIIDDFTKLELNNPQYFIDNNYNYNSIKFSSCDLYGSFPVNIAEQLNEIFENGFKIWFTPDLLEDTNAF